MAVTQCPSDDQISAFINGQLVDELLDELADHFDVCPACCRRLSSFETRNDPIAQLVRQVGQISELDARWLKDTDLPSHQETHVHLESSGEKPIPDLDIESTLSRYQLRGELGCGGIGYVVRAHDPEIGRELAVKVLRKKHSERPEMIQRFTEEAQIAGQLEHPGIVPIYEIGQCEDERPFFTMKLVNGQSLDQVLKVRGENSGDRGKLLNIFLQVCQAVAFAHSKGVVHRDLKPANVMVGEFGEVQVMDWGLAKVLKALNQTRVENVAANSLSPTTVSTDRSQQSLFHSRDGTILGTPSYMPPEQALGNADQVDRKSDVFALGAILIEILTRQPLYCGKSSQSILSLAAAARLQPAFARLDEVNVDPELKSLVRVCLRADKAERPCDASEVAGRMESYLQSVEDQLHASKVEATASKFKAQQQRKTFRITVALLAVVTAVILLAGFLAVQYQRNRQRQIADTQSQLEQALTKAETILNVAESSPVQSAEFPEGLAAIELANSISGSSYASKELRTRTGVLSKRYQRLASHRKWFEELEELRHGPMPSELEDENYSAFDWKAIDERYENLFHEIGLSMSPEDLATAKSCLESQPEYLRRAIIAGLDSWWWRIDGEDRKFWLRVLNEVDPLDDRKQLRNRLYHNSSQPDQAQAIETFDPSKHSARSIIVFGHYLWRQGNHKAAIDMYRRAVAHHPNDYWIHHFLAQLLVSTKSDRHDEIIGHLNAAVASRPESLMPRLELMAGFGYSKRFEEALIVGRALEPKLVSDGPRARMFRIMGRSHWMLNELNEAVRCYQKAIATSDSLLGAHENLAKIYSKVGLNREMSEKYRLLLKNKPGNAIWAYNLGNSLLRQRKFRQAVKAFDECLRLNPEEIRATINMAQAKLELGHLKEAGELINSALSQPDAARWKKTIAKQKAKFDRWTQLKQRIPAVEAGQYKFQSPLEKLEMARICQAVGDSRLSLKLHLELIEIPKNALLIRNNALNYHAALSAIKATAEVNPEKSDNNEMTRDELSDTAFAQIKQEFDFRQSYIKDAPEFRQQYALMLRQWQDEPAFAVVREQQQLAQLSSGEQKRWSAFWAEVQNAFEKNWNAK